MCHFDYLHKIQKGKISSSYHYKNILINNLGRYFDLCRYCKDRHIEHNHIEMSLIFFCIIAKKGNQLSMSLKRDSHFCMKCTQCSKNKYCKMVDNFRKLNLPDPYKILLGIQKCTMSSINSYKNTKCIEHQRSKYSKEVCKESKYYFD